MCESYIERVVTFDTVPFPDEVHYYLVSYQPWLFGLLRKSKKLVAVMPHGYHDNQGLMLILQETYLKDYNYGPNGKPVWSQYPAPK